MLWNCGSRSPEVASSSVHLLRADRDLYRALELVFQFPDYSVSGRSIAMECGQKLRPGSAEYISWQSQAGNRRDLCRPSSRTDKEEPQWGISGADQHRLVFSGIPSILHRAWLRGQICLSLLCCGGGTP